MSTMTITTPITAPVVPAGVPAEVAEQLGDDILLSAAAGERATTVATRSRWSAMQSHTARAWTRGGSVD